MAPTHFYPILFFICYFIFSTSAIAQDDLLAAGPMAGYNTATEVVVWIQTKEEAEAQLVYWPEGDTSGGGKTDIVRSKLEEALTIEFVLQQLTPDTRYHYRLWLNEKKVELPDSLFFFTRTEAPYPTFSLATGSCAYIEDDSLQDEKGLFKFGGRYDIFDQIAAKQPDYMLWLGDNIYLRGNDWESVEGVHYRYTHSRQTPALNRFLRVGHHLAIWDDHDFGPNDSDGTWGGKDYTKAAFERFWGNPAAADSGGTYFAYRIGDVELFMTDCRYFRSPVGQGESFLGDKQIEWLIQSLKASDANFKLVAVGTQLFSNCNLGEGYCFGFPEEFARFMKRLEAEKIPGIVFLSGDKHYTEISRYDLPSHYPLYELTFSPLTSFPTPFRLKNTHRVKRTSYKRRNFGMLHFEGEPTNRYMRIELYNFKGKLIWERKIWARQLGK